MTFLVHLNDPKCLSHALSGGKGASLARLIQWGFPVPDGAVVISNAYRQFIGDASDLASLMQPSAHSDPEAARLRAEGIQERLNTRPIPVGLEEALAEMLREFPDDMTFSVRSSATLEDLASAAFAGQHETYLNCRGLANILERIKACWISLWSHRALVYRENKGFDHLDAAMAVVVQTMAQCDVAGVGFSIDPVSGRLDRMVFDANYGLGESVVGGEVEVDHFEVDKKSLALLTERVARKTLRVVSLADGVARYPVPPEQAEQPCLDSVRLNQLGKLLLQVEQRAGFPQDIEWGFRGDALVLLQARPITAIPPRWTRDESAERFPNVMTPLTWDLVEQGFHRSLNHSFQLMGLPPFSGRWFALHDFYVYGDQNAVELYARRNAFVPRTLDELRTAIPMLRQRYTWVMDLPIHWSRDLDRYLIGIGRLMAEPLEHCTLAETWDFVLRVRELGSDYFLPNIAISLTQGALHRLLRYLLGLGVGEEKAQGLFDDLISFCETKTGVINRELQTLAETARSEPALKALLVSSTPSRKMLESGELQRFSGFFREFWQLIENHGHREVDFDPYHATWLEAPWLALDPLRLMVKSQVEQSSRERERAARMRLVEAEYQLTALVPKDLHFFYLELIRLTRAYASLDDLEHYQTTRITLPFRKGLREMGRRLVEKGVLREPMDIFFCPFADLDEAVGRDEPGLWEHLSGKVEKIKADYLHRRDLSPPWNLAFAEAETECREALSDGVLRGLAGSPGVVEGCIHRVMGEGDFATFPQGAVLLARTTNPAWTPLFHAASAVVTESGGPLSHGAVTAREMGIPAVMGVRDACHLLSDGQRVRVDGGNGTVQRLEGKSDSVKGS